jgi:hypothetical protein
VGTPNPFPKVGILFYNLVYNWEATHAAMLMEGEGVRSLSTVQQKNNPVWAALGHSEFALPGTSVSASLRRLGHNAGMEMTESAVKTATGDSGTAHGSVW